MLPASTKIDGANGTYRPMGAPGMSASSQVKPGAYALKMAVDKLDGKDVEKAKLLSPGPVTNETVKLCETGSWEEMKAGCNAFPPTIITNPGWFASVYTAGPSRSRPAGRSRRSARKLIPGPTAGGSHASRRRFASHEID